MTVLVAKFKNKREADRAASVIRKMQENVEVVNGEYWEDFYLGQMIDEGMKEKGSVSLASIRKKLRE
ncbi:MAG: hypothetical protein LBE36_10345 [Flavobacteriaceae bacterium]|jgi:hypothetical protein|nr:hypothetical protein [Flavobacteriaceae bacterium]